MKNKAKPSFLIFTIFVLVFFLCACKNESSLHSGEEIDSIAVSQTITTPSHRLAPLNQAAALWIKDGIKTIDGKALFCAIDENGEYVYCMDTGSGEQKQIAAFPSALIIDFAVSPDGDVFVLWTYNGADRYELTRLDSDGKELDSGVVSGIDGQTARYIACTGKDILLLTDKELVFLKNGDADKASNAISVSSAARITVLKDGTAILGQQNEGKYNLYKINPKEHKMELQAQFNSNFNGIYSGLSHDLYLNDGIALFSFDFENNKISKLLSWNSLGIIGGAVAEAADGKLICSGHIDPEQPEPLLVLEPMESRGVKSSVIRLATTTEYIDYRVQNAIRDWNTKNPHCPIEIVNYSSYINGDDTRAAQMKLAADIASGNVPDIYDFSLNSIDTIPSLGQYARRGMLEDLYPYIDSDPILSRSDFFTGYLRSIELDGGLYELVPEYSVLTTFADATAVGTPKDRTYAKLNGIVDEQERYTRLFDEFFPRNYWLGNVLAASGDKLVNWATGECYFESDYFKNVLETAKAMPETEREKPYPILNDDVRHSEGLLYLCNMNDEWMASIPADVFGANYCFAGLPELGNVIFPSLGFGISSYSENKQECWQFLRQFLLEENSEKFFMSPRRDVMEERIAMRWQQVIDDGNSSRHPYGAQSMRTLLEIIDSITISARHDPQIWQIVYSETGAYFAGERSVEDTMHLIQSRASIYVAEQYG